MMVIKLSFFEFLALSLGAVKLHFKLENLKSLFFLGHPVSYGIFNYSTLQNIIQGFTALVMKSDLLLSLV